MTAVRSRYDVVVVGARVAGAATAMLLARRGYDVLVVDRATHGAETLSTHALMKGGVLQLHRWGLLDRIIAAGTPPVRTTTFHYGDEDVPVPFRPAGAVDAWYAPRRTLLDPVLVDAARDAGAGVAFGTSVTGLVHDDDGTVVGVEASGADGAPLVARARVVIGADGVSSRVARSVAVSEYLSARGASAVVYAYFEPLDVAGYEWHWVPGAAAGAIPTNDGTLVWSGGSTRTVDVTGSRREPEFWSMLHQAAPHLAAQVRDAARTSRWHAWAGRRAFHRRSWGPGWALVGDAAHFTDPISAHGITDAFRDAEFLAAALDTALGGTTSFGDALARYETARDRLAVPLFRAVDRIAEFDWDLDAVREHLLRVSKVMQAETRVILALDDTEAAA